MRITRPLSFVVKQMTKTIGRKTVLASFALTAIAGGVIAGQNLLTTPNTAQAITPPDSCFAFNTGTGTITDYYNNEANNPANPACPKDVDIPSTIGGVAVTSIGDNAFSNNQLTAITIPSSVTSIGGSAFYNNRLTAATIPSGVTSIGSWAFSSNQLASITIPSSVTSIGSNAFSYNQLTNATFTGAPATTGVDVFSFNQLTSIAYNGAVYGLITAPTTPPEACFVFDAGTGRIQRYLFFDLSLISSGTACTYVNIVLPSYIGGIAVSDVTWLNGIGIRELVYPNSVSPSSELLANDNQLTSLTLPTSIASIGDWAFYGNKLNKVNIPNNISAIKSTAFMMQNPRGGLMERSIVGSPGFWSDDPAEVQQIYDTIWYAQLYTANSSNPNGLKSMAYAENDYQGKDANDNGTAADSIGGHIINPASITVNYLDTNGNTIAPSVTVTGLKAGQSASSNLYSGDFLHSYLVTESNILAPLDPDNPTPEEQATMDAGFEQYYYIGDDVTLEAPATINGLQLLTPASTYTLQLHNAENTVNFIYGTPLRTIDFATPVGSATNPTANSVPSSVTPLLAKSTFGVSDTNTCSQIQSASLVDGSDFTAPQTDQDVLGGLSFTIDCTASGGQADVSFALGGTITDLTGVKVYKQDSANTITDITNQVTLTNQSSPDGIRTTISYSIIDGADLDDDGLTNGTIVDPIYLTIPSGASFSLLGASSSSSEALAATGVSIWLTTATAILMLTTGTVIAIQTTQRKQT